MSMHQIACSTVQKRYFSVRSCYFSVDLFLFKVVNWLSSLSALYIVELSLPCGETDDASLPPTGDQLPVDPRPNKAIPQSERTRFILVHNLPPEGRDDGITSVRLEVPADGIIDDLKQAISDALTNSRLYLPRRAFFLKLRDIHQPYFTLLKSIEPDAELSFQWSATEATCFYTSSFVVGQ